MSHISVAYGGGSADHEALDFFCRLKLSELRRELDCSGGLSEEKSNARIRFQMSLLSRTRAFR